ncbi:MAG: hypothetical protein KAU62_06310 [Candidatus Heimdallarchaeota archaeon]|nr:hypothetical protein [Candidatus Heimdallarchaeota archaeon]MCG3255681.1 hypothetical protein [Candidatus Heimdallarchaeota archaeon]MCK4610755.1 hypothetical protein [Candidatus Heimdallarchaeota archaeon]
MIHMEPKEIAEKFLEMHENSKDKEIIPFITNLFDDDETVLKNLINTQIQIKELGGGWPPVGKQITTMEEILVYSKIAIEYALQKDAKLVAGMLNHNIASFCFPNMDDGVDETLIESGYIAAVSDLELRKEIGDKVPMLWAKWLVGVSEYIKGDVSTSIKTLEETSKIALEEPQNESLAVWADMMKTKFQLKSEEISKEDASAEIARIESVLTKLEDDYGLGTLKQIKEL